MCAKAKLERNVDKTPLKLLKTTNKSKLKIWIMSLGQSLFQALNAQPKCLLKFQPTNFY